MGAWHGKAREGGWKQFRTTITKETSVPIPRRSRRCNPRPITTPYTITFWLHSNRPSLQSWLDDSSSAISDSLAFFASSTPPVQHTRQSTDLPHSHALYTNTPRQQNRSIRSARHDFPAFDLVRTIEQHNYTTTALKKSRVKPSQSIPGHHVLPHYRSLCRRRVGRLCRDDPHLA